ncbi:hypothetical protein J6590_065325 [Homalodisca vitripennis]|nr:hypothetical protein J6590_065325 [Homalodisca vitripennis]
MVPRTYAYPIKHYLKHNFHALKSLREGSRSRDDWRRQRRQTRGDVVMVTDAATHWGRIERRDASICTGSGAHQRICYIGDTHDSILRLAILLNIPFEEMSELLVAKQV